MSSVDLVDDEPTDDPTTDGDDDPTETDVNPVRRPTVTTAVGGEALLPDKTWFVAGFALLLGIATAAALGLRRFAGR